MSVKSLCLNVLLPPAVRLLPRLALAKATDTEGHSWSCLGFASGAALLNSVDLFHEVSLGGRVGLASEVSKAYMDWEGQTIYLVDQLVLHGKKIRQVRLVLLRGTPRRGLCFGARAWARINKPSRLILNLIGLLIHLVSGRRSRFRMLVYRGFLHQHHRLFFLNLELLESHLSIFVHDLSKVGKSMAVCKRDGCFERFLARNLFRQVQSFGQFALHNIALEPERKRMK